MAEEDRMLTGVWSFCAWTGVLTTFAVSSLCFLAGASLGDFHSDMTGSVELPLISKLFMSAPSAFWILPYLPGIWLIIAQIRGCGINQLRILTVASLAWTLLLLAIFVCGAILPFTNIIVKMRP